MALKILEFFGYSPLDPAAHPFVTNRRCPFVGAGCIKPDHGACSVQQVSAEEPIICCPNRMYGNNFEILEHVSVETFGPGVSLLRPDQARQRIAIGSTSGDEVVVFGHYWGQELALPRPRGSEATGQYYVDWILAKLDSRGAIQEFTAVEVQTIDTTGNYSDQAQSFFSGLPYTDAQGRTPGYSNAGMNWENVNKRILPQIIYKGHALRRERRCTKGLYFVCPKQVYSRIKQRLGGTLHEYHPSQGAITFLAYELGPPVQAAPHRGITLNDRFTTTVDQIATAFTSPMNLPDQNVYEAAINAALSE